MRKLYIFGLIGVAVLIIGLAFADQMTFTTYYPAPYGVYRQFTTTSKTCLATNTLGTDLGEDAEAMVGIGTTSPDAKLDVESNSIRTIRARNTTPAGPELASPDEPAAVYGDARATSGRAWGVMGVSHSPIGAGVYARNLAETGTARGVMGGTQSADGIGVEGGASHETGATVGVKGYVTSSNGWAGWFWGGKGVYIRNGADPYQYGIYPDLAEFIAVAEPVETGDVVVLQRKEDKIFAKKCNTPYDKTVLGIILAGATLTIEGQDTGEMSPEEKAPLGLAGRLVCKVTTENGPISCGDLLTTSGKPGYAMKAQDKEKGYGAIIGKALEPLEEGEGKIVVLVNMN